VPFLIVEREWKATNTPSMPTISPNTSNQKFEITILFNIVESSGNYIFDKGHLCLGGLFGSHGRNARINFTEGSFNWKLKVLVQFLSVK
jgi:hypothetical protein